MVSKRQQQLNEAWADEHGGRAAHPEMYRGGSGRSRRGRGARFSTGGSSHVTVNPTDDPKAPKGGHYVSVGDDSDHSTAVFDDEGSLADGVKANRDWKTVPRQD